MTRRARSVATTLRRGRTHRGRTHRTGNLSVRTLLAAIHPRPRRAIAVGTTRVVGASSEREAALVERCAELVAGPAGWSGERRRADVLRAIEGISVGFG